MVFIQPRKLMIISSLVGALLLIGAINLLKFRGTTGYVVADSSTDTASLLIVFIVISAIAGGLLFMTMMYRQNNRY
jgi:hypothetical protein